jgi:hypothetical protein
MVWLPTTVNIVANVANPPDRLAVPKVEAPSRNVTVPVGVPVNCGDTAAENDTICLNTDGFSELDSIIETLPNVTVCVSGVAVLELKLVSPEYKAVMEWLPADNVAVETVAVPVPDRLAVPSVIVPPSRNVTVPVGVPLTWGVTVAVNATVCPKTDGFSELATVVVVVALLIDCVIGGEVLELKFVSPSYRPVMVWLPAGSVAGEKVAVPVPDRLAVPNVVVPPSRNVTVPEGVPPNCGLTVAVNVTVCPKGVGFIEVDTTADVAALFTVCVIAVEELELKFASPL